MQTCIQKIGDSFGVLLPKQLLDSCGFDKDVTISVENRTLVLAPAQRKHRAGWAQALNEVPEEALERDWKELRCFSDLRSEWETEHWQWPDATNEKA